jgi:hypothetical protein
VGLKMAKGAAAAANPIAARLDDQAYELIAV